MEAYAAEEAWDVAVITAGDGRPQTVRVTIPSTFEGGSAISDSILPTQPTSTIYRVKFIDIAPEGEPAPPFKYVEVDWNTEGVSRGPNGAFINPHCDFHFYLFDRDYVNEEMSCPSSGRTCDSMETGYAQMRRFLNMAPDQFVPGSYFPDTGSSIDAMGLHNLDGSFDYTVDSVNNNPVIIYGTFDGELAFLRSLPDALCFPECGRVGPIRCKKHLGNPPTASLCLSSVAHRHDPGISS